MSENTPKGIRRDPSPWTRFPEEMARKRTALRLLPPRVRDRFRRLLDALAHEDEEPSPQCPPPRREP